MMKSQYFDMGSLVITTGIDSQMMNDDIFFNEVMSCLKRYSNKDWGELDEEDKAVNDEALNYPEDIYLLGSYDTCHGKIYIITNRISEKTVENVTTICFPAER